MRNDEVGGNAQDVKKTENIIKRNKTGSHVVFNAHVAGYKIK